MAQLVERRASNRKIAKPRSCRRPLRYHVALSLGKTLIAVSPLGAKQFTKAFSNKRPEH